MFNLIVLKPFLHFRRGDFITDKAIIEKILSGPSASSVVKISAKKD